MLGVEGVLCELNRVTSGGTDGVNQGLPPGFRFRPTDEELVTFYLAAKVFNSTLFGVEIAEIDLNSCEPWELPEVARMGEKEWYFFSLRDRKYPMGLRTKRMTGAGYWKATGKDRLVHGSSTGTLLGMKKTLVFYHGRAPRGKKTKWVMHEYRLDGCFSCRHPRKDEWVICRITHKTPEKKSLFLDKGQQSWQLRDASSLPHELLPCSTPSLSIDGQVLQNPLFHIQAQEINPLVNFGFQVPCPEQEAGAAGIPKQGKAEHDLLPHLQDPFFIDEDHFYHYNLCGEILPPFVLDKIVSKGSWPVDV